MLMDGLTLTKLNEEDQDFLELFTEVTSLSLNSCSLISLDYLPILAKLTRLELQDNRLTGVEIPQIVEVYGDTLECLKLSNNLIRDFQLLSPLKDISPGVLINLDLSNNPVTEIVCYRDQVFELLPDLEILDGLDREGNEINSENDQECEEYDIGDKEDGGAVMSDDEDDENSDGLEDEGGELASNASVEDDESQGSQTSVPKIAKDSSQSSDGGSCDSLSQEGSCKSGEGSLDEEDAVAKGFEALGDIEKDSESSEDEEEEEQEATQLGTEPSTLSSKQVGRKRVVKYGLRGKIEYYKKTVKKQKIK
ncbi:acidic leucine-rich nuclear phosphoprotein 32 family member a [Stylonychia lemnae]|uniref:Acidic leucine-rich nuclear phosphoprotein 32 family member a n=1 Tax=Stylonychia lemnae TaxID=5949 RepID=A0A077ZZX8_STYLE|nr:acidic leucine-rich nuclear phosphoprotein 32 family member a [Stylonychia lemnae]|eukprot:CDW74758.1 acidic leucine-rich nuclear phosphoprotein 32 family member a [Stylonychia lemnae]